MNGFNCVGSGSRSRFISDVHLGFAPAHEAIVLGPGTFLDVESGHIHHPDMKWVDDVLYINDGDWVEHCTFVAEDYEGKLALVHWADQKEVIIKEPARTISANPTPGLAPVTVG